MFTIRDLKRFVAPLQRKIFCLVGRAILTAINNSGRTQRVQITPLGDEVLTDIERIQEYGLETYPLPYSIEASPIAGTESVVLFINGNRDHGIVISVGDRKNRLRDLEQGEVALYTYEDANDGGHRIHLKAGQITDMNGIDLNITQTGNLTITIGGNETKTVDGNSSVTISGNATVNVSGTADITAGGKATITAATVDIDGGGGSMAGCITGKSFCHFTGSYHGDKSSTVKVTK